MAARGRYIGLLFSFAVLQDAISITRSDAQSLSFRFAGKGGAFTPAAHSPGQNPRFCRSPRLRGSWPQGRFGQAAPVPCPAKKKTSLSGGFQKLSNSYFSALPQLKACATTPPSTRYWWFAPSYTSGCSFSGSILPSSVSTLSSTLTFTTSPTRRQVSSS